MKVLTLDSLKHLFKDTQSMEILVTALQAESDDGSICAVVFRQDVVCTVLGPAALREVVQDRLLKRLSEHPDILGELQKRLDSDDLVK